MDSEKLSVLSPREAVSLDPVISGDGVTGFAFAEDAVEEMVVCLAGIEASWTAGEFGRLRGLLAAIGTLADTVGLPDVAHVALHAEDLAHGKDEVALAAVVSRLVRVGEISLAQLLEIAYRQR